MQEILNKNSIVLTPDSIVRTNTAADLREIFANPDVLAVHIKRSLPDIFNQISKFGLANVISGLEKSLFNENKEWVANFPGEYKELLEASQDYYQGLKGLFVQAGLSSRLVQNVMRYRHEFCDNAVKIFHIDPPNFVSSVITSTLLGFGTEYIDDTLSFEEYREVLFTRDSRGKNVTVLDPGDVLIMTIRPVWGLLDNISLPHKSSTEPCHRFSYVLGVK